MGEKSASGSDNDAVPYQFRIPKALKKDFFEACRVSDQRPAAVARSLIRHWLARPAAERAPWSKR
jgi:hypothetical protein